MAQGHCRQPVATGHQARRKRAQFTSTTRKNRVAVVQVRWNIDSAQLETFSSVWVPCVRPPGTPANEKPFPKWGECSQIGIFLCHSPHHASSIPLILSTQTGLVSPQFHCVFDDDFDTVKKEQADTSIWKIKAHLQEAKEQVLEKSTRSSLVSTPTNQLAPSLPSYG